MRVTNLHPEHRATGRTTSLMATFDVELNGHVRLFGLRLMETPDGKRIVYSPNGNGGRRLATFSPELAREMTRAAISEFERQVTADGSNSEA